MNLAIEITDDTKASIMEARLLLRSVFGTDPDTLHAQLNSVQHKQRARLLDHADLDAFLDDLTAFVATCKTLDIPLRHLHGRVDSGAVTNGYRGQATATTIMLNGTDVRVTRGRARSVAYGDNGCSVLGLRGIDTATKVRLKALGWTGAGGTWKTN